MVMSLAITALGIGAFCALLYRFATHGLALLAAVAVGTGLYELTAHTLGSIAGGVLAGIGMMAAGPLLFSASRSMPLRFTLACAYGLPAGYAGYRIGLSLLQLSSVEGFWLQAAAVLAAIVTGLTATIRLAKPPGQQASLA